MGSGRGGGDGGSGGLPPVGSLGPVALDGGLGGWGLPWAGVWEGPELEGEGHGVCKGWSYLGGWGQ